MTGMMGNVVRVRLKKNNVNHLDTDTLLYPVLYVCLLCVKTLFFNTRLAINLCKSKLSCQQRGSMYCLDILL